MQTTNVFFLLNYKTRYLYNATNLLKQILCEKGCIKRSLNINFFPTDQNILFIQRKIPLAKRRKGGVVCRLQ